MANAQLVRAFGLAFSICFSLGVQVSIGHAVYAAEIKLATDAETRIGMEHIRRRVIDVHTLITHRRMPVARARQFTKDVRDDVARISQARSSAPGDDPIVPILEKIKRGASAISDPAAGRSQIDGLFTVIDGLEAYAAAFDHPGWRPLQEQ